MTNRLYLREWLTIGVFGGFLLSLGIISWIESRRIDHLFVSRTSENRAFPSIEITIHGAVEKPGTYSFRPGISLREVLEEVKLSANADRRKLKLRKIYFDSQRITIPAKSSS